MSKRGRMGLLVSAILAVPAVGQAQSANAFDGTYAGVSRQLVIDTTPHHQCPPGGGIGPLTISNGSAQTRWGDGTLQGQVTPQGQLTMRATNAAHFDGQVDGRGAVKGRTLNGVAFYCGYEVTWQKKP
jgi:hypothetical protein